MTVSVGKYLGLAVCVAGLALLAACRTPDSASLPEDNEVSYVEITTTAGRIVKVNEKHGYVVMECVSLPSRGEVAIVYDEDRMAGRLRITGPINSPFAVADIMEGTITTGETVKIIRRKRVKAVQKEGRK